MTDLSTILRLSERATLTEEERRLFDEAVQQIPADRNPEFTALLIGSRGMVRHHGNELIATTEGYRKLLDDVAERYHELLDTADGRQAELVAAARELRAIAENMTTRLDEVLSGMGQMRTELDTHVAASTSDRADLRRRLVRLDRRLVGVIVAVVVLLVEMFWRYWPAVVSLLSVLAVALIGGA